MTRFDSKTQIIISKDLASDVFNLIEEEHANEIVLIIDSKLTEQPDVVDLKNALEEKVGLKIYSIQSIEPTTTLVNEYVSELRGKNVDLFIGIGGGSVLDLTKALSVMTVNEGKVEDYHGTGKRLKSGTKKIAIPTTAGTGSEVTPGAVLLNTTTKIKRAISGRCIAPDYAILYAIMTLTMPDSIIASTGMDALAHAIESYTAKSANDITRMYSKQAFSLIYNNLPKIFEDRQDIKLREKVLLGSCLAGYAIYNSNTGASHSMSYALGIYHNIPHGIAVASLLPKVIKGNIEKGCYLYADLYDLIDGRKAIDDPKSKVKEFCSLIENYRPQSYIDNKLSDYGINIDNYTFLAKRALDLTSALNNNPVEFGLKDSQKVLRQLL